MLSFNELSSFNELISFIDEIEEDGDPLSEHLRRENEERQQFEWEYQSAIIRSMSEFFAGRTRHSKINSSVNWKKEGF